MYLVVHTYLVDPFQNTQYITILEPSIVSLVLGTRNISKARRNRVSCNWLYAVGNVRNWMIRSGFNGLVNGNEI